MRRLLAVLVTAGVAVSLALWFGAAAASAGNGNPDNGNHYGQVEDVGPNYNHGKALGISKSESEPAHRVPKAVYRVGDVRTWLALDDYEGSIYLKNYTLRGIGHHIEVWVANKLAFPGDDCRNALGLATVTDAQVQSFITEFDDNIYPKEAEAFSTPPRLDGKTAPLNSILGTDANYLHGQGDNIVVLVDNVRDANYYEPDTPEGHTYIAGFFYSTFNYYFDRNAMTIDVYDWLHRTGANPPDDTADPAYQACPYTSGAPRPHLYEATFAHEYQHLLEYYSDPDEYTWVNEGLSDYAQTLVGYVDPNIPHGQPGADGHIGCFEGWADPSYGGPENSLTVWGDQGAAEILCDYGAAYSFTSMLAARYGDGFMSMLHRDPGNGLQGLDDVLASYATGKTAEQVLHEWAAMMALDANAGTSLTGGPQADYTSTGLYSEINWANPEAYGDPGAPPNGSDYVPLGTASSISTVDFQGSATLPPKPVHWVVQADPPFQAGNPAFYSNAANGRDEAIVRQVTLGSDLQFDALWNEEDGWDFGFVQVSTDGGATYQSLACTDTTTTTDPGALPTAKLNVPGFSGYSGGWKHEACDVSSYAGQTVYVSFRAFNDPATLGSSDDIDPGFWVDDIATGSFASDGSDLTGWLSPTQVHATDVEGWTVQLVGYDGSGNGWYYDLPLDAGFHGTLTAADVASALGGATTVGAIVMQDDPTETVADAAGYTLTVNGVVQPGGPLAP